MIPALPILLCPTLVQAHSDADGTADGLTAKLHLDVRQIDSDFAQTAGLTLAGVSSVTQDDLLWGRSSIGLQGRWQAFDAELTAAWSDQEDQVLLDHARLGWQATGWRVDAGRMNPLDAAQPAPWPLTNLLLQGLLGDDHWHADGAKVQLGSRKRHLSVGAYGQGSYVGAIDQDQSGVALYSMGGQWQQGELRVSAALAYAPDVIRQSTRESNDVLLPHTHSTNIADCGRTLTCVDGDAKIGWLGLTWQPNAPYALALYGLARQEDGVLNGNNGVVDYRGELYGWLIDGSYRLAPQWQVHARIERLSIEHSIKGVNASLVTRDAGLLDNDVEPLRYGLRVDYQVLPQATLQVAAYDDQTRERKDTVLSVGVVVDWQQAIR